MDVDGLLLVLIMKTKIPIDFTKIELFSFSKLKVNVCFYLLYRFPNFENKYLCVLDVNISA